MKKIFVAVLIIVFIIVIFYGITADIRNINTKENDTEEDKESVSYNSWLNVEGNKLLNSRGEKIQLRGISSHGIQWYNDLYTYNNIKSLKDNWGINIFRIAMYTEPSEDGYIKDNSLKDKVITLVDNVIDLDMYVIIDWHILKDGNPTIYEKDAIEFFDEMSKKYKDVPNVIFEICNEPNGEISWDNDVKPYAENIIKTIRMNSPKSLIIVGIPDWCKDLPSVSKNPLNFDNIMYSVHFYAGTDGTSLRNRMDSFLSNNLPIFVSECGITDSTGAGKIYEDKFKIWIKYLDAKNISWIFWSFSNKNEESSLLTTNYVPIDNIVELDEGNIPNITLGNNFNDYLTETGKIIKEILNRYNNQN